MAYDAFTIDTDIANRNGLRFESGLLAQLNQFKYAPVQFILSDIVRREIHRHLVIQVTEASERLNSALVKAEDAGLIGRDHQDWNEKFEALQPSKSVAGERLNAFVQATGATIIPSNLASMDNLVARYFAPKAPFEATGKKKNEFPDAIALLSMESWAKNENKRILAVSLDNGWKAFAEKSEHIDVLDNLADAMALVQEHTEAAEKTVIQWIDEVSANPGNPSAMEFVSKLREALSETPFDAEGYGHNCRGGDGEELRLTSYEIVKNGDEYDLAIIRLGSNEITVSAGVQFEATAVASFSMAVWDGIDKEDIGMGYQTAQREIEFEGSALLTFALDSHPTNEMLKLISAEIVEGPGEVNFGEIEVDYGDDAYDDWLESKV